jgi:hypothetical protein
MPSLQRRRARRLAQATSETPARKKMQEIILTQEKEKEKKKAQKGG